MITDSITKLIQRINLLLEKLLGTSQLTQQSVIDIETNTTNIDTNTDGIATEPTLQSVNSNVITTVENVYSKINRIQGSSNYTRTLAYYTTTDNVTSIIHTGTTLLGAETITETIVYIDAVGGDFRINTITYS